MKDNKELIFRTTKGLSFDKSLRENKFYQIQLNSKSLIKLFPDKKELINQTIGKKSSDNSEELVISLIEKF